MFYNYNRIKIFRYFSIFFFVLAIFIFSGNFSSASSISYANERIETQNQEEMDIEEFKKKMKPIIIDYYWGDGCSHCEKLKPWLDSFEALNHQFIKLRKHEIWKNEEEAKNFNEKMSLHGIKEEDQGTPSIIIEDTHVVLIGDNNIANQLPNEVEKALKLQQKKLLEAEKTGTDENALLGDMGTGFFPQVGMGEKPVEKNMDSMTLKAIFLAAIADSVNPCAIMVLIILLSSLIVYKKDNKRHIFLTAFAFILAVYITYFLLGLGIASIVATAQISNTIVMIVGIIAIVIGLLNLKDAFFYRKGDWAIEIPQAWRTKMTKVILAATSPAGAFFAGGLVTMFELPCTGGPYLFGISLIAHSATLAERMGLLAFYNFVFILPLILIAILVIKGTLTIEKAEEIRNENVKKMHFITGIIMILIGSWAVFFK